MLGGLQVPEGHYCRKKRLQKGLAVWSRLCKGHFGIDGSMLTRTLALKSPWTTGTHRADCDYSRDVVPARRLPQGLQRLPGVWNVGGLILGRVIPKDVNYGTCCFPASHSALMG